MGSQKAKWSVRAARLGWACYGQEREKVEEFHRPWERGGVVREEGEFHRFQGPLLHAADRWDRRGRHRAMAL